MAALHEALISLSPIDWDDVPKDNLETYAQSILKDAELLCNSVPPPSNGLPYAESTPISTTANSATSHKDMHPSKARPLPPHQEFEELQSQWGKQLKFSAKENPLEIAIHKMAGKDRHGAWFARRSIHEGIGFTKFRAAMEREFAESLKVQTGPGAGCIRGIAADKVLEDHTLNDTGRIQVYQLSAQFPGPTTPREFITLLLTSDSALTEKSVASQGVVSSPVPRSYMIVSRPITHPDAPERSGYIRGQYESVELIREIPLDHVKTQSSSDLSASKEGAVDTLQRSPSDHTTAEASDESELNPVEWIMITRSDPGGGIPRFMVDRGTPSTMITDIHKFLDWAAKDNLPVAAPTDELPITADKTTEATQQPAIATTQAPLAQPVPASGGVLSQITQTLDAYAPTMISSFVHDNFDHRQPPAYDDLSDDSTDLSDTASFTSAIEGKRTPMASGLAADSSESISMVSTLAPSEAGDNSKKKLDSHDKKLLEIRQRGEKLDRKLEKKRQEERHRLEKAQAGEEAEAAKAKERHDKDMQKVEEKHRKEIEKLEAKKTRELEKLEQKKQKLLDRDVATKLARERDEFRSQVDLLKKENAILRERIEHFEGQGT